MAIFYSSWYYYGSGGALRLRLNLEDPVVTSATSSVSLSALVDLETDSLYDSVNTFTRSGDWGSWSGSKTISNGSSNATIRIFTESKTFSTSYTTSYVKSFTATMTGIEAIGTGTVVTVSGSVTIPKRPANPPDQVPSMGYNSLHAYDVTLTWGTPANNGASLTNVQIAVDDSSGFGSPLINTTVSWRTSYLAEGLTRNKLYYAKVRAQNSAGWGDWSTATSFTTLSTVPDAPSMNAATSITSTGAVVSIASVNNGGATITSYQFRISTDPAFGTSTTYTQATTSKTFAGLTRATLYYVQARAYNTNGWGAWSSNVSFTTLQAVPIAPTGLSESAVDSDSATISYTAPADDGGATITQYEVRYSPTSTDVSSNYLSAYSATTSKDLTSLTSDQIYYYKVRAQNSVGWGAWSVVDNFTTTAGVPTAPQSVVASAASWDSVDVSWSAPADDRGSAVTSYVVDIDLIGSSNEGLVTSTNIDGLDYSTDYQARVAAVNANGQGDWSAYQPFSTPSRIPYAPAAPSTSSITANGVDITSAVPSDNGGAAITSYAFQVDDDVNFGSSMESTSGTVDYTRLGLLPGTTYYVRTAGINSNGTGEWSTASNFDTLAGYQGVLSIDIAPSAATVVPLLGVLRAQVALPVSGLTMITTVDNAKLTVPNPLKGTATVVPGGVTADTDVDVGLEATAWIPQNLFVDIGLTGVVNHEADAGFIAYLVDATIPSVQSTPMFYVDVYATYNPRKYGDELSLATLIIADGYYFTTSNAVGGGAFSSGFDTGFEFESFTEKIEITSGEELKMLIGVQTHELDVSLQEVDGLPQVLTLEAVVGNAYT